MYKFTIPFYQIICNVSYSDNKTKEEYEKFSVLPDENDTTSVMDNFKFVLVRTIVKFLPALKDFQRIIPKHLSHPFSKEMSAKSEVVSLFSLALFNYFSAAKVVKRFS